MNAHRIETTVNPDGTLLKGIAFQPGDQVEVIIIERIPSSTESGCYSLHGKPVQYDAPFEPVAEAEWGARNGSVMMALEGQR